MGGLLEVGIVLDFKRFGVDGDGTFVLAEICAESEC